MIELTVLFSILVTFLVIVFIIVTLNNMKKTKGVVREEEVYYLQKYPRQNRFRNFRENRVLNKLRRGGLTGDEKCKNVCGFCINRGYDFCNEPEKVQGCDCETNTRIYS